MPPVSSLSANHILATASYLTHRYEIGINFFSSHSWREREYVFPKMLTTCF